MSDATTAAGSDRLAELRSSAKGWHGIQLAALGFIGLCGVIRTGDPSEPMGLQVLAGVLVVVAFVLACAGIYLVGRAAWPLYRGAASEAAGEDALATASGQLTRGLLMTFLSIAALALAAVTSWWPDAGGAAGQVEVRTSDGRTACGELAASPQLGALRVVADSQPVDVALDALTSIAPTDGC